MNIILTTLSFGENYTKDYTLRMIEDVISMSDIHFYITTDCRNIIEEKYPNNNRLHIKDISRDDVKFRLPIGKQKAGDDFNFNMRYLCLEHVKDIEDSVIIFTDCDNSFDWWDKEVIELFMNEKINEGYDYFGPRTSLKIKSVINEYNNTCKMNPKEPGVIIDGCTMLWHKFWNYDMVNEDNKIVDGLNHKWAEASVPSEYLLIFYNNNGKLNKMVEQWKWFHDYLNNKNYTYGTWAEGFEIGISCMNAGFNDYDIGYGHSIWSKVFEPNGYKTGKRGGVVHPTEK